MSFSYTIKDIEAYLACPLKFKLKKLLKPKAISTDEREIITKSLADTFFKGIHMQNMSLKFSAKDAMRYMSRQWTEHRAAFMETKVPSIYTEEMAATIMQSQNKINEIFNWIVKTEKAAIVEHPYKVTYKGVEIKDQIDCLFVRRGKKKTILGSDLYIVDSGISKPSVKNLIGNLRGTLALKHLQEEVDVYKNKVPHIYLYSPYHDTKVRLAINTHKSIDIMVENVLSNMKEDIFYPSLSKGNCKDCIFRYSCDWNQA